MAYVGNKPDVNYTSFQKQDLTGATGGTLTLSTPVTNANDIQLFINHVRQESGSSYVASGTTVTLQGYTVSASDDIYVIYHQAFQTTQPPDGSVGTAKIADDAVTSAKLANDIAISGDLTVDTSTLKVDSSANQVSVGHTSPTAILDVRRGDADGKIAEFHTSTGFGIELGSSQTLAYIQAGSSQSLKFETNGSNERMRINADGRVDYRTNATTNAYGVSITATSSQSDIGISGEGSSTQHRIKFFNSNGQVGAINTSGSATSYNTSSDYRLKENVVTDWDATSRLKQLKPARFNFKTDKDTKVDGFLAHEVSSVVPEAITGEKDAKDKDGKPEYQSIDQSKLVPLLVKTIQELEARITKLEGK